MSNETTARLLEQLQAYQDMTMLDNQKFVAKTGRSDVRKRIDSAREDEVRKELRRRGINK